MYEIVTMRNGCHVVILLAIFLLHTLCPGIEKRESLWLTATIQRKGRKRQSSTGSEYRLSLIQAIHLKTALPKSGVMASFQNDSKKKKRFEGSGVNVEGQEYYLPDVSG